ncbi:Telomere-Associated Protein Rif1 [Manis pentadactyla]|nr:Telomere-Associated Protein Rif1 [Manis pentadactyla]
MGLEEQELNVARSRGPRGAQVTDVWSPRVSPSASGAGEEHRIVLGKHRGLDSRWKHSGFPFGSYKPGPEKTCLMR